MSELEAGRIYLPERWAVLEQALAEMGCKVTTGDTFEREASIDDFDDEAARAACRDPENTRSRNKPVRPSDGNPMDREQQGRGGVR